MGCVFASARPFFASPVAWAWQCRTISWWVGGDFWFSTILIWDDNLHIIYVIFLNIYIYMYTYLMYLYMYYRNAYMYAYVYVYIQRKYHFFSHSIGSPMSPGSRLPPFVVGLWGLLAPLACGAWRRLKTETSRQLGMSFFAVLLVLNVK